MGVHLLVDFGSTYTKVLAVDLTGETILGRARAPTTVGTDITIGLKQALAELTGSCGVDPDKTVARYATNGAAGGLRMAAI
jgi:sugar (pentulose or hexulose) kinase